MISLTDEQKSSILSDSIYREVIIKFPDAGDDEIQEIGSENIIQDSFELTQSICDESEFTIGGCIAGQLTVQVINIEQALNNMRIQVYIRQRYGTGVVYPSDTLYPSDELYPGEQSETVEFLLFTGTIDSSLRQKNRAIKEIVAYDDFYKTSNISAYNYFSSAAQYSPTQSLGEMISTLLSKTDTEMILNYQTMNPNWSKNLSLSLDLVKSVCSDKVTISDLLQALCELNAGFGYMNEYGYFKCMHPSKSESEIIDYYADLEFEEFEQQNINMVSFKYNNNNTFLYGSGTKKSWYISDNLVSRCSTDISEFITAFNDNAGTNYIFNDLYKYRPFTADVFARWWLEPGDKVKIKTGYNDTETVDSFIFSRTIKGINGMRVNISAKGVEYLGKDELESE